ncbi:hypothetical protein P5G65_04760 [Paenibacillus chondroitinus]|uniref:Uncharacterized protein n=1 Tax=Paenibacillus chondroitinus TaxID=59842 RepID=A0ABU6D643_9BACL|nr:MULTISPECIES: hypothetical protein [Paenibacillus]MCY9658141.1 hypothetical protein [Paenibacillus anseongense]MEB4793196.1 hypothetical protein [Paenibacillus chondroitinus]
MKWKQELLWVKRNEYGVALRIEEERPAGVPVTEIDGDLEEDKQIIKTIDSMSAIATLNRYFALVENTKPTLEQAEEAVKTLCHVYGAANEEVLFERGDPELIETYKQLRKEIMMRVKE